ncbi:TPA_asm: hypothetical protein vir520_00061 [Caudoviricetes sp. vir520]|nr:TPA_asm: hypothetical protein vir520_00061 [Caudoviricetes sp. vir520]
MWVRRKTVQWPVATEVDFAALTVLTSHTYLGATWELRVFYDDDGNLQNSTIYTEYTPDGVTWFEEQAYTKSVTAGERWTTYVVGGFIARISALKLVAAEDVVVGIFDEKQNCMYREIDLLDETTIEVDPAGTIMYASGDDTKECDAVVVFIDDTLDQEENNLEITIWMAPESPGDAAPTWHVAEGPVTVHTAKDRCAAILVRNTMGQMIKVLGVKSVLAADVNIWVKGRLPYFRQWVV